MMRLTLSLLALTIAFALSSAQAEPLCSKVHWNTSIPSETLSKTDIFQKIRDQATGDLEALEPSQRGKLQQKAEQLVEQIKRLQNWADRTRQFNSNFENVAIYNARRRLYTLKMDIKLNNQTDAVGLYRTLFNQVENSYLNLQKNLSEMASMKTKRSQAYLRLAEQNKKLFKVFGENFEEYMAVRSYLESLAGKDPLPRLEFDTVIDRKDMDPSTVAFEILGQFGIPGEHRLSAQIAKPVERIPLKDMYEFNYTHAESLVAKYKQDIRDDLIIFGKSLILNNPVFTFTRALIARVPTMLRVPLTKILDLFMEKHLEHRYMNHIDDVVSSEKDLVFQLDYLRAKNDDSDTPDEFLITFARLTLYSQKWIDLKKYAHQVADQTGSQIYQDFAQRMDKAEGMAIKLGTFSPGQTDFKARLTRLGVLAGSIYTIYELSPYFHIAEQAIRAQFHL